MPLFPRRVACAIALLAAGPAAFAAAAGRAFVAPGLWEVIADVHGPMQQQGRLVQQQCWNADGESGQALATLGGPPGNTVVVTHSVVNTGRQSTVHLHTTAQLPQGPMTQDITLVFRTAGSSLRGATMSGHGGMAFSGSPTLHETFTEHGHWLGATCPAQLPPAKSTVLQSSTLPGLAALQKLTRQLQARYPGAASP